MATTPPTYAATLAAATVVAALGVSVAALGVQAVRPPRPQPPRMTDAELIAFIEKLITDSDIYAYGYSDGVTRRPPATPEEIEAMRPAAQTRVPGRRRLWPVE